MVSTEVIDQPLGEQELGRPHYELARLAAIEMRKYVNTEISEIEEEDEVQAETPVASDDTTLPMEGARIVSWVEASSARIGHALAISGLHRQGQSLLEAYYYEVDRGKREVIPDRAQAIELPTSTPEHPVSLEDYAKSLEQTFDRDQLAYLRRMLIKARVSATSTKPVEKRVDGDVLHAIAESNLGNIPISTQSSREAPTELEDNVFLDQGLSNALKERHEQEESDQKKMLPVLGTIKEVGGIIYVVIAEYIFNEKGEGTPIEVTLMRKNKDGDWDMDMYNYLTIKEHQEITHTWDRDAIAETFATGKRISSARSLDMLAGDNITY